mgnify:CR=1 FL=1
MAIGGKVHGTSPGTFGDMGAFRMHPLKTLNAMGDGGMVVTEDADGPFDLWIFDNDEDGTPDAYGFDWDQDGTIDEWSQG